MECEKTSSSSHVGAHFDIMLASITKTKTQLIPYSPDFITIMGALIAIAGIVTPLGLYETLVSTDNVQTPFQYLKGKHPLQHQTAMLKISGHPGISSAA